MKVCFNCPDNILDDLKKLAAKRGTTVTDVLLSAIGTEVYLDRVRKDEGQKVLLENRKGKIFELIFAR